jgi:integrase
VPAEDIALSLIGGGRDSKSNVVHVPRIILGYFSTFRNELRIPSDVTARCPRLVAKARANITDLPSIPLRGLTHTHATLPLQEGINPKIVQERIGNSDISTTFNISTHVTPTIQTEALDRLTKWMG